VVLTLQRLGERAVGGWRADGQRSRGDVARDDGATGDEAALAECHPWQYRRVRPDGDVVLDGRTHEAHVDAHRVRVVREHGVRTDEHVVAEHRLRWEVHARLEADSRADLDVAVDDGVRPDDHLVTQVTVFSHEDVVPGPQPVADTDVVVDDRPRPDHGVGPDGRRPGVRRVAAADGDAGFEPTARTERDPLGVDAGPLAASLLGY
jgi:hypothetical protein